MKRGILTVFFIFLLIAAYSNLVGATNNPWTHIYYYGWYDGVWAYTTNPSYAFRPVFASQCPYEPMPPNPPQHLHPGNGNTDISSVFYPDLGAYKNLDNTTASQNAVNAHKGSISSAQIKNVILSYGEAGNPTMTQLGLIAGWMVNGTQLKTSIAIRDYDTRSRSTVDTDIRGFLNTVSTSNRYRAQFMTYSATQTQGSSYRSIIYLYNAGKEMGSNNAYWYPIFKKDSSLRNISADKYFIVLAGGLTSGTKIMGSNFDGNFNYSPAKDHSGDSFYQTQSCNAWNSTNNWIFSAGVSPGYNTSRTKADDPNCKPRSSSSYAAELVRARTAKPHFISVVSFNEWREGSGIEPVKTVSSTGRSNVFVWRSSGCGGNDPVDCGYEYMAFTNDNGNSGNKNLYLNTTSGNIGSGLWTPVNLSGANCTVNPSGPIPCVEGEACN